MSNWFRRCIFPLGGTVFIAIVLMAGIADADTNTANITLSASSGTPIEGNTFDAIDAATDSDATLQIDLAPGLTTIALTPATIDVDGTAKAISIDGTATVLGVSADVMVTATWLDADVDTTPTVTFGVKFSSLSIDTINDSWTPIGGELPLFNDAWAVIASTPHSLDLAALPPSAETFYGLQADGFELGSGLNFRGSLDLSGWEALGNALETLAIDASAIELEGEIGATGLLFDNANADKSSLSLSATVDGTNLPAWLTTSTTTIGFAFDGSVPAIAFANEMVTDFGGATNTFETAITFDPNDYGSGTVTADFALVGNLTAPFGAGFLALSDLTLSISTDLGASPASFAATLAANIELPDMSLVALTIDVMVDGSAVSGTFSLDGAITLTQILATFQPLLDGGFDATALATDDVSLDGISFSFVSGTTEDQFELSATATVDALAVDVLVAGTETGAGTEVIVGLDVTEIDGVCGCIRLGTLLDLPVGSAVADLELPEVHLVIPLQATTLQAADLGPATTVFFEQIYGTLPSSIELTEGINLSGRLPLDPLGGTVQDALGYADGAEIVIDGSLGVSLTAFAGGGTLDLTNLSLQATLPPVAGALTPWAQLTSDWTIGVEYADGSLEVTVGADVDVDLPGEPTLSGTIQAVITKSGTDFSVHVEASVGAWAQPFGLTWLGLSEVLLTIDYQDDSGTTTVEAALSSSFEVGGKAFSLDVAVAASGGDYDLTFSAALDDNLTVDEMLQFLGVNTGSVPADILTSSIGPISLTATVNRTGSTTTFSVAVGGTTTISIGGNQIDFQFLVALDQSGDFRLGLAAANNLTLSSIVPSLPQGLDFQMPSFSIVLANAASVRSSDALSLEEFTFFGPSYGCASSDTPADCSFDVDLPSGVSVVANAPIPTSLDALDSIGVDTGAGVQIQGTIPLFGSGDIGLSVDLPPWIPPGAPDWFKSGSLSVDVTPTSLSIVGELAVRLPKSDASSTPCATDESQCDILTFELSANLDLGAGLAFNLQGALRTDAPWEQAFGIEWLTINELVLQVGVTTSPPAFTLGFRGDVVIGTKDISISLAAGITAGIPTFQGFRAASAAGLELADVIALQNEIAPGSPIQLGNGLPNIAVRNIELMFAITENPELCLTPGLIIAGDLYIDPTSPAGTDSSAPCSPTPPTPQTSSACLNDPECLASVRLSVSDQGIIAIGQLSAFDLGPIAFENALIDLTLTTSDQHLTLSGGIAIQNFGSGNLALTIGSTEFSFDGEVQLFDTFFASLSGTATLDSPPGVHVEGIIRQELVAALNDSLRPFFEDFASVVTVINGIIDELQDPNKTLDDVASKILMAPADLQALGIAVPQWLITLTNGINDGLDAYADVTGTTGPFGSLLDPILQGFDFTVTTGVPGTIVPRTCLGTWQGTKCWSITPTPASSYKVKVWPFGKVTIKVPAIPGVPGVIVPESCLVVTVNGTCYAIPPIVIQFPGLCDINAVSAALQPCNSTGLKNAIVDLLEDGFETITGATVDDVQATLQEIADSVSSSNLVLIDAPCIGFELDLGGQSSNSFFLDFHLVLFNQDIYFTNIGWDFDLTVAQNADALKTRLINVLLGIEDGSAVDNKCEGVVGTGGSSTPVANVMPPSNVVLTPAASSVLEGSQLVVSGTFDAGSAPSATTSVTIGWGDGQSSTVPASSGTFSATHVYSDDNPTATASDVHNLTAVVTNSSTGTANGAATVTVFNVAPTIDTFQTSATSIAEGGSIVLSGTYSDAGSGDTHTLAVTWGDGSSQTVSVAGGTFSLTKKYPDDIPTFTPVDTYAISATLRDDDGGSANTSTSVTVSNVQPTVAVSVAEATIDEGGGIVLTGTVSDVGLLDRHEITIDWGDGTTPDMVGLTVGARAFIQSHVYIDDDPTVTPSDQYTITVTVSDDDQGVGTTTQVVTVDNVAPSDVTLSFGNIVLSEGDETGVFISFADPGADDVHTVTVDWGDDSASSTVTLDVGTRQQLLSHVYEDDNPTGTPQDTYPIGVTIVDDDGGSITQAVAEVYDPDTDTYVTGVPIATISNVEPSFEPLVLTPSIDENGTASLSGSFEDPGLLDTYELVIDWGDGTPTVTLPLDAADRGLVTDPDTGLEVTSTFVDFATSHQYLDDNPTGTASDDYTVTVTVTDDDTGTDTTNAVVTVNDVAPVVEAAPLDQTPQYSDPLADDIVLTAYDVAGFDGPTETLVAATQWKYGTGAFQSGLPADLAMATNGCDPGGEAGSIEPRQTCTWMVSGITDIAPGLYTIRFTVTDDDGLSSSTDVTVDVQPEDARAYYTGPSFASTASARDGSAEIELRATIRDITAEDILTTGWDAYPGDIRNAIVDFIDRETGTVLCTSSVELLFAGFTGVGTATCNWQVELSKNTDAESFVIGTVVRGWYERNETDDDAVVTVAKPLDQFITGGGYIDYGEGTNESAGVYAATDDTKANFGFNVKFNNKGTNLKGRATVVVRSDGRVYKIKTNALQSLGVVENAAEFEAKANLTDVTDEDNPVSLGGNLTFQMDMTDFGTPNDSDTIGWTLYDSDGTLLFSSNWTGVDTAEQIAKGNLVVHD